MVDLLQKEYIEYLNSLKPLVQCCNVSRSCIRFEEIDDPIFDIQDRRPTIKQPYGTGSVTYKNPNIKKITIINYEDFLNQQTDAVIKKLELKKCDFIVYHSNGTDFFILNELSQSSNASNKRNDAILQLSNALMHFFRVPSIKSFIQRFTNKSCVFSNREKHIATPDGIADAFDVIKEYLPEPRVLSFQPITKLNFKLIESTVVDVS